MTLPLRTILAIIVTCALCLASTAALGQNGPGDPGPGSGDNNGSRDNQTGQTDETQQRDPSQQGPPGNQSDGGPDDGRGPPSGTPGAGEGADRRPVDPVTIRDDARGFRTEAPAGSARPEIALDAAQGTASVQRSGVHPLQLQLDSLVEFEDEDGDGAYDLGETLLQRSPLKNATFEIIADPENETRDVVYPLEGDGRLILRFHLGTAHSAGVGAKFDVIIEDYPYQSADSMLALGMRVDTPAGLTSIGSPGERAVIGKDGDEVPYLSWQEEVLADGTSHTVGSSVHLLSTGADPGDEAIVYWAYPQGAMILHDPVLGVAEAVEELLGDLVPYVAGLAAAAGVLALGYTARRRRRL